MIHTMKQGQKLRYGLNVRMKPFLLMIFAFPLKSKAGFIGYGDGKFKTGTYVK